MGDSNQGHQTLIHSVAVDCVRGVFLSMLVFSGGLVARTACAVRAIPAGPLGRFVGALGYVLVMACAILWIGLWIGCSKGDCL